MISNEMFRRFCLPHIRAMVDVMDYGFYHLDGIGGLTFGADPIAVATAFASELKQQPVSAFSIRKTQKEHGIIKWVEGDIHSGQRVVVIDDVATTGGSTIKAIERARSEGLDVVKAVILVDRQEGGMENIRKHVEDVSAIVTRDELITPEDLDNGS